MADPSFEAATDEQLVAPVVNLAGGDTSLLAPQTPETSNSMTSTPTSLKQATPKTPFSHSRSFMANSGSPNALRAGRSPSLLSPRSPKSPRTGQIKPERGIKTAEATQAPQERVRRLVIHKLVLINFKSYAGVQEIGPFNTNFSAVVGPNGSGKSNVIDSLLFVFGFRANKMRHSKLTNLIHKSESHPDLEYCRVEVHFEDVEDLPDGTVHKVPDSSLIVARQVTFANGSSYDINDKRSSYNEVTTLLKGRGIDLDHKRFLILQGEVESIAMMKPKAEAGSEDGLLEYLEDIIGTSNYKPLIEDAEKSVEELKDGLEEVQGRFDLSKKELDTLDDRRATVEKYMNDHNQLALNRSSLYQLHIFKTENEIKYTQQQHQEVKDKLESEQEKNKSINAQITQVNNEIGGHTGELTQLKESMDQLNKQIKSQQVQTVKIEEKRQQISTRAKKLERTVQSSEKEQKLSQHWLDTYASDAQQLENDIAETNESLENESQVLGKIQEGLREKTQHVSAQIEALQQQVDPWRARIQEKDGAMRSIRSDLEFMQKCQADEKTKYQAVVDKAKEISLQGQNTDKELKKLNKRLESVTEESSTLQKQSTESTESLQSLYAKVDTLRAAVSSARESRKNSRAQNGLVSALLRLRDEGKLKGLYGRLGSLGAIDAKYDVAVSTAAPGLDNLVVDTVATGQKCIEYLREHNLGRAKFILLDRLPKQDMRPIETPENVPRLFDLIKPRDPKFAPAFYSVLSNTLVANDMEQARRVAYGARRFRVVTTNGMLVETSGAMSGGGQVSRGRMAAKSLEPVSMEDLTKLERELASVELDYAGAQTKSRELEERKLSIKQEIPSIETEIRKVKMSLSSLESQMTEIKTKKSDLKTVMQESTEKYAREQAEAEKQLEALTAERDSFVNDSTQLETEIQALQERILQAGGIELRIQSAKVQDLRSSLENLRHKQQEGVEQRRKMQQAVKKQQVAGDEAKEELSGLSTELEQLNTTIEEYKKVGTELEEQSRELYGAVASKESMLEELNTQLAEYSQEVEKMRQAELNLKNEFQKLTSTLEHKRDKVEEHRENLQGLSLYDLSLAKDLRKELEDGTQQVLQWEFSEHTPDELNGLNVETLERKIAESEELMAEVAVNEDVLEEYRSTFQEFKQRREVLQSALGVYEQRKTDCANLKQRRLDEFMAGFNTITLKLKQMYKMITLTGNADLELVDSLDPFSEGISFSVMPPNKSWKNISNLSGGEKTLSSLALVFALHHYKPTPLYVMDEIDAALDFRNVSIIANYIKERTRNGQFIVISLRNNMFELADRLIGIYKVDSMTRSVTLDISN